MSGFDAPGRDPSPASRRKRDGNRLKSRRKMHFSRLVPPPAAEVVAGAVPRGRTERMRPARGWTGERNQARHSNVHIRSEFSASAPSAWRVRRLGDRHHRHRADRPGRLVVGRHRRYRTADGHQHAAGEHDDGYGSPTGEQQSPGDDRNRFGQHERLRCGQHRGAWHAQLELDEPGAQHRLGPHGAGGQIGSPQTHERYGATAWPVAPRYLTPPVAGRMLAAARRSPGALRGEECLCKAFGCRLLRSPPVARRRIPPPESCRTDRHVIRTSP